MSLPTPSRLVEITRPKLLQTGDQPPLTLARWFTLVDQVHYLHFGLLLWGISGVVTVGVSLATPPPPADSLPRLTWASR